MGGGSTMHEVPRRPAALSSESCSAAHTQPPHNLDTPPPAQRAVRSQPGVAAPAAPPDKPPRTLAPQRGARSIRPNSGNQHAASGCTRRIQHFRIVSSSAHRRSPRAPDLDLSQFRDVCRKVQHATEDRIISRDGDRLAVSHNCEQDASVQRRVVSRRERLLGVELDAADRLSRCIAKRQLRQLESRESVPPRSVQAWPRVFLAPSYASLTEKKDAFSV